LFPSEEDLALTAKAHGAFLRRRGVEKASDLLRLALLYGLSGLSLRQVAAVAGAQGIAHVSDVALLNRLRHGAGWLLHLLTEQVSRRCDAMPPSCEAARRIRLVDATVVSRPGSKGTDWRIHLGYSLRERCIDYVEVTDATGGESLRRLTCNPGEIVLGDRGYAHRRGLAHVLAQDADFVVRLPWSTVPLLTREGAPFDLFGFLRTLPDAAAASGLVAVAATPETPEIPARIVAIRKAPDQTAAARRKISRAAKKKGKQPDPRTMEAAGYVMLLTSLTSETYDDANLLELYRFRWQIELAFKRMKSILHLDALPAKDPRLAKSFIAAQLLAALLIEDMTGRLASFFPWGYPTPKAPALALVHHQAALA